MPRKIGFGLIVVVATAAISTLQGKEPETERPLRDFFEHKGAVASLPLLTTELVRTELELTDEQKEKTVAVQREYNKSLGKIYQENPSQATPKRLKEFQDEANAEIAKKLDAILKPHQIDRLLEIIAQMGGPMLLSESDVAKTFDLTDDQKQTIKSLAEKLKESADGIITNAPGITKKEDIKKQLKDSFLRQVPILKETNEKIRNLLTPKQRDMLDKMKGK